MAELNGRRTGQCGPMLARDRFVREKPEQRPDAFAAWAVVVKAEVIAHHLVQGVRAVVLNELDHMEDLGLSVGYEQVKIGRREHGRRIQAGRLGLGWGCGRDGPYMIPRSNE